MPGFRIGLEEQEAGIPLVAAPVYTYTWQIASLGAEHLPDEIYAKECTLPEHQFESEEIQAPHIKYKYAKGIIWNDVKIVFYDTQGIRKYLDKYRRRIWNPTTGIRPADDYKFDSGILVFLADDFTEEQRWLLKGSWIKGVSWSQLTYTSSDVHQVNVTVSYDWAESEDPDDEELLISMPTVRTPIPSPRQRVPVEVNAPDPRTDPNNTL